ncbi:MAG TPA: hypothetical protein VNA89_13095 [Gemmatimonadaceae bacterium]|nr:hypothetical protein [Gemmatimonadaceae bacterium]
MRPRAHRRPRPLVLALAVAASLAPLAGTSIYRAHAAAAAEVLELAYATGFGGVAMDGEDMLWTGGIGGRVNGEMSIRLHSLDPAVASGSPGWRVRAIIFVAADQPRDSFAAELDGVLDWRTRRLEMHGVVTDGARAGASIVQRGELKDDYASVGMLRIGPSAPLLALR